MNVLSSFCMMKYDQTDKAKIRQFDVFRSVTEVNATMLLHYFSAYPAGSEPLPEFPDPPSHPGPDPGEEPPVCSRQEHSAREGELKRDNLGGTAVRVWVQNNL